MGPATRRCPEPDFGELSRAVEGWDWTQMMAVDGLVVAAWGMLREGP